MILGKLVGKGNTADVYEFEQDKVIKVFHRNYPKEAVEKEFNNAKMIGNANFHKAKVYDMVLCNDSHSIIYQKIEGKSLFEHTFESGDILKCADVLANEHKLILANTQMDLMSYKSILHKNIEKTEELSEKTKDKILSILNDLPEGNQICHGDLHPGNIIVSKEEDIVIDYMNICRGQGYLDIARTVYLMEMTVWPFDEKQMRGIGDLRSKIVDAYLQKLSIKRPELQEWLIVIEAARLSELGKFIKPLERKNIFSFLEEQKVL